jgi:hypothetical protein
MLPDILVGNPSLISVGLWLYSTPFFDGYFSYLHRKGLIRLKTSAEITSTYPF